ncbi:ubiquitin-conjugating enzyme E2 2-like [Dendronephthya gigantea]|uniref:ubiquitin-conjugating enzyme E2 2-like n=1 Tax=Dendronephthya gigantea TaxID=151771 RepID=UPI00106B9E23|nr:ubiquitin-conjugating enzyme E2 2-like [Dendronephthya gigantea]XP_028409076.1 ubiquitin-conjugating enzyme E2 2-like [Dendronephthya gigantea]
MSKKRILKEFQTIQASKPHGIEVSVPTDSIYIWEAKFAAPDQSLYKGATLKIQIVLPEEYPLSPPTIRFLTPVFHVNIEQSSGHVCLGFVSADKWNPTNGVEDVLRAVFSLLITPEVETAQDQRMLGIFKDSKRIYDRRAQESAKRFR